MVSIPLLRRSLGVKVMALPTSPSIANSLLVSRDPTAIERITHAMRKFAIATEVCVDVASARQVLNTKKFDAVTVDFDLDQRAPGLIGEMRISRSNRTVPALAITRNKSELALAYCAGASFVLERPLTTESLNRTLAAAYGLIVRERRRYFRCLVRARVVIRRVDIRETCCNTTNISEGGMEIRSLPGKLIPGMRVHAEFTLPGSNAKFKAACEICWRDTRGYAGLRFLIMPLGQRCDLQEWLADRLEESLPESVAERFRNVKEFSLRQIPDSSKGFPSDNRVLPDEHSRRPRYNLV